MYGRFQLLSCFLFLFFLSLAVAKAADRDRLDSIGVQKVGNRTFILHQVVGQETLFSISRRYKVPMVAIQEANEALKQGMKDGQTILVPFGQSISSEPVDASSTSLATVTSQSVSTRTTENSGASTTKVDPPIGVAQPIPSSKPTETEVTKTSSSKETAATTSVLKTTHKIVRGESLFSIAAKYKVTIAELKEWNSLTSNKVLVGQSLKIFSSEPVETSTTNAEPLAEATKVEKKVEVKKEEPKIEAKKIDLPKEGQADSSASLNETNSTTTTSSNPGEWISHSVKSGESLFSLSKEYGTSIEDLIQWNALTSNNLKVGQSIKVGKVVSGAAAPSGRELRSQPTTATTQPVQSVPATKEQVSAIKQEVPAAKQEVSAVKEEVSAPNTSGGFTNTKETGLAELIPGTEANKKYLVLHRTAPVGSVIRVKNEENNLTIFARVVGVLPETGDNSKVLIKLSQAAFEQLKGVNARFPVEILY